MRFYHRVKQPQSSRVRHIAFGVEHIGIWEARLEKTACGLNSFFIGTTGNETKCGKYEAAIVGQRDLMEHRA